MVAGGGGTISLLNGFSKISHVFGDSTEGGGTTFNLVSGFSIKTTIANKTPQCMPSHRLLHYLHLHSRFCLDHHYHHYWNSAQDLQVAGKNTATLKMNACGGGTIKQVVGFSSMVVG